MMLIDNRNYLRLHQRPLFEELAKWESSERESSVIVESSRKGAPTVKMMVEGKPQYIHSKYDPEAEANKLIDQLENMEMYNHVLFIGTGFGYHIKQFLTIYSNMSYSIYEPNIEMLSQFLTHQNIMKFPKGSLQKIITTTNEGEIKAEIQQLHKTIDTKTFVYTLPACTKLYETEEKMIMQSMKDLLKDKRSSIVTNFSFQKRWTINSIKNFPKVLQTPNILHDIDKDAFKGKPAILVAAGPSLSEELENLKYIKENGLAYIFSVGSAINALIEHDIYPDGACTYDPSEENQLVFEKLKDKQISDIPLIFGSSVGHETLENYSGQMLHMLTNQDTVAPHYLHNAENINVVMDAPSIAVVTFQMLKMLGCSQIILAGQNLSYPNNRRYAEGIQYDFVSNELSDQEAKTLFTVKDVHGNDVQTDEDFTKMRQQLEMYIGLFPEVEVINTTNGGAHIEGTTFISMNELINEKLKTKNIVKSDWFKGESNYNMQYVQQQQNKMKLYKQRLEQSINNAVNELRKIDTAVKMNQSKQLGKIFTRFDKEFNSLRKNPFFKAFIEPMVRVHNQRLSEETQAIRFEQDSIKKGEKIVQLFGGFLIDCKGHIQAVEPFLKEFEDRIFEEKKETETQVER